MLEAVGAIQTSLSMVVLNPKKTIESVYLQNSDK